MSKLISLLLILLMTGCATVGPVSVEPDDTSWTILAAFTLAVLVFVVKSYIEYVFAKKLEDYKTEQRLKLWNSSDSQ